MTNEAFQAMPESKSVPFGIRLKSSREAMGLEKKDVAAQLRLSEKLISLLEEDTYPADLPATFIRGYLRSYAKLLAIPEPEIKEAMEPLQPKQAMEENIILPTRPEEPVTSSNYFMQFMTYVVVLTLIGLMGMWWYSHTASPTSQSVDNIIPAVKEVAPVIHPFPIGARENIEKPVNSATIANSAAITALESAASPPEVIPLANYAVKAAIAPLAIAGIAPPAPTPIQVAPKPAPTPVAPPIILKQASNKPANPANFILSITSHYGLLNSLTDLVIFLGLAFFAYWWYTPSTPAKKTIIKSMASRTGIKEGSQTKKPLHRALVIPNMIALLIQDLFTLLTSKRFIQVFCCLIVLATIGFTGNIWWKHKNSSRAMFDEANLKPKSTPASKSQINNSAVISSIHLDKDSAAENDVSLSQLANPKVLPSTVNSKNTENPSSDQAANDKYLAGIPTLSQ